MAEKFRTMWKGFLRLSLVTIPVRMVTATRSAATVSFHQIDRKTNQRIQYQKVAPGRGVVDKDDIVRGYEFEPGRYVFLEDEELDAVKIESAHTIELMQFVEACEIDPLYFEKPYYLLPDGDVAEEGYRTIRDALRGLGKVGIGQQSVRGRENLVTVHPAGDGLLLETLRYEEEVKEADEVFTGIGTRTLRGDLIEMAKDLIERKTEPFAPDRFENHYTEALRALVKRKVETGKAITVGEEEEAAKGTVVDFMEALRRSVAKEGGNAADAPAPAESAPARKGTAEKSASRTKSAPAKPAAAKSASAKSGSAKSQAGKAASTRSASGPSASNKSTSAKAASTGRRKAG